MVPLTGANRVFVQRGLGSLSARRLSVFTCQGGRSNADSPKTASVLTWRLGSTLPVAWLMRTAFRLLVTDDPTEAVPCTSSWTR